MKLQRLSELGGVAIEGIDLKARSPEQDLQMRQLLDEHGLLVVRNQTLTKAELSAATGPFGGPITKRAAIAEDPEAPGLSVLSSRGANGDVVPEDPDELVGQVDWHSDQGYLTHPNRGKILYCVQAPEEGGMTGFIDGQRTYAALSDAMRARIEPLHVIQSWNWVAGSFAGSRRYKLDGDKELVADRFPDLAYRMVHTHPETGAKVLNVPPQWAAGVVEMPGPEGEALIAELVAHITQDRFQYWHRYTVGDAVIWDNWRFLHAASGTLGRYVRTVWSVAMVGGPELGRTLDAAA